MVSEFYEKGSAKGGVKTTKSGSQSGQSAVFSDFDGFWGALVFCVFLVGKEAGQKCWKIDMWRAKRKVRATLGRGRRVGRGER